MAYTLYEHSQDWALLSANAPGDIADAYAAYVVAGMSRAPYGELGAYHAVRAGRMRRSVTSRSASSAAVSGRCESPAAGECQDCGCSRSLETVAA